MTSKRDPLAEPLTPPFAESAFPIELCSVGGSTSGHFGMSLRDYFAAKAMPEAIRQELRYRAAMIDPEDFDYDRVARSAYKMANDMLQARQAQGGGEVTRNMFGHDLIEILERYPITSAPAAVAWLRNNLTEAALVGCHHCDEAEPGAPCRHCGLKSTAQDPQEGRQG